MDDAQQVTKEEQERGVVDIRIFITYIKGFGGCAATCALVFGATYPALLVFQSFWLDRWASHSGTDNSFYAGWYGCLGAAAAVIFMLQVGTFAVGALRASSSLHNKMLLVILMNLLAVL